MNQESSGGGEEIEAARLLLNRLGVTPEQLLSAPRPVRSMPTFAEYIELVSQAVTPGARRVYGTYWNRVLSVWGGRRLDEPSSLEIKRLAEQMREQVIVRRNSRGGRTAAEHLIASLRCIYAYAVADGLLPESSNPAKRVPKPRRLASTRRALSKKQLVLINDVATTTGNDPHLDGILLRLHIETACRRDGGLSLRRADLDAEQCLVQLREKGETVRWQPISPTLADRLGRLAIERGCSHDSDKLLRYRNGTPVTRRRHDYLWHRLGKHLPWVRTQQISTHWLRHTTLTWVERRFGYAVAQAYAGHAGRSDVTATSTYVRADAYEVTRALVALTGELHPMLSMARTLGSDGSASSGLLGHPPSAERSDSPLL